MFRILLSALLLLASFAQPGSAQTKSNSKSNGDAPPPYSGIQPYESYGWELVMWHLNRMWSFSGTDACTGARLTGIANVLYEQVRGLRPNVATELFDISQADRLNGLEFRARYVMTADVSRVFDRGQWKPWAPGLEDVMTPLDGSKPRFGFLVELRNGQWTATFVGTNMTLRRIAFPCSQMPQ